MMLDFYFISYFILYHMYMTSPPLVGRVFAGKPRPESCRA